MRIAQVTKFPIMIVLIIVLVQLSGCAAVNYYGQSIKGQLSILYNRESIDDIVNDPDQDAALKIKLKSVSKIRHYATQQLGLPKNKSYLYYTDIHRPYVVWNIFAAPEFSLNPINWCYPIVGCVSYRGYFKKEDAVDYANELLKNGDDTFVTGIAAYSTLGWFDDPILSSMIKWRDRSLAGVIFHELTHQVLYIANETAFNEAFASAVERIGSIQWLIENDPLKTDHYVRYLDAQSEFRLLLIDTREELKILYESKMPIDEMRASKAQIIAELESKYQSLKKQWPTNIHFDSWFSVPINNARFTASMTYLQQIPAFYRIFIESDGNWAAFYKAVLSIADLDVENRKSLINSKLEDKPALGTILSMLRNRQPK